MRWTTRILSWIRALAIITLALMIGYLVGQRQGLSHGLNGPNYSIFWQVRDLLNRDFLGEMPSPEAQVYGATKGLTTAFNDPYTAFLDPTSRTIERDAIRGEFGGIGAALARNDANEMALTVTRDKPAARAGVQDGDILLAVDGKPITAEMTVQDAVLLIRGDIGARLTLTLRRGQAEPFTVTLARERIETSSVDWRMLDAEQHIGYVRISIFGERTAEELKAAIVELAAQKTTKLVLDLRGNGGGLLLTAVDIASQFLTDGVVVYELKKDQPEQFYPVKAVQRAAHTWEIILLVDAGTASASEIVAGALQDAGRATLIGEKTYGKGSVQEVHELPDGSSLHVTVARWLTPQKRQIDKVGLTPNVIVNISQADRDAGRDPQLARGLAWLRGKH